MTRPQVLELVHLAVGFWYVVLSITAMTGLMAILRTLRIRRLYLPPWVFPTLAFGTTLFLAGCGAHHIHMAIETIPQNPTIFVRHHYWHHLILTVSQAIGAPMCFTAGLVLYGRTRHLSA